MQPGKEEDARALIDLLSPKGKVQPWEWGYGKALSKP